MTAACPAGIDTRTVEHPTSWEVPAEEVRPGMRWRSLGRGYVGRTVEQVTFACSCRMPSGRVDPVTRERLHYDVVLIVGDGMHDYRSAGSLVTVTTGY